MNNSLGSWENLVDITLSLIYKFFTLSLIYNFLVLYFYKFFFILGRIDFQVKIHGQRIELGEIEGIVLEMEENKHCVVIDKKRENCEKYLVCYYVLYEEAKEISNKTINIFSK